MLSKSISPYVVAAPAWVNRAPYTQPAIDPIITNQEALDKFLESSLAVGTWITFKNAGAVTTTYMVSYIIDINRDFATQKIGYNGCKETHLLVQLGAITFETAWCRWASIADYRPVSAEEMRMLKVDDAILQDYIQKFTPEIARARIRV